jgi:hypothetical protein
VSFLPQFLKGVDIIVGQDWMLKHSCYILFDQGQCSLIHPEHPDRIFLNQMPTGPYHAPHTHHLAEPEPECEGMISAALMARYLARPAKLGYKVELLVLNPVSVENPSTLASMNPSEPSHTHDIPPSEKDQFTRTVNALLTDLGQHAPASLISDLKKFVVGPL